MFGFGKKVGPTVGLEINSSTISVMQLEKIKTDIKVSKFASVLTPPDLVREGLLVDPEALGIAVRELFDSVGLPAKGPKVKANIAIPGQSVVIRLMPVPKGMPGEELNDVVRQEAINNLPFSIEEASLDWSRVPGTSRMDPDGVEREDVLLGAIQRNITDAYYRMAEGAKIEVGRLDISSLAAVRALVSSGMVGADGQLSLVVNIRQDATDITLVNKSVPLFSRSVLIGVETIIDGIMRSVNCPADEALGLISRLQLLGVPTLDVKVGQAAQVARSICGDLSSEVGRSLEFYMSQVGMVQVDQVVVCGPGLVVPELDQFLSNRLNLNTVVANPLQGIVYDSQQILDDRRAHHTMLTGLVIDPKWTGVQAVEINLNKGPTDGAFDYTDDEEGPELEEEEVDTPWFAPALIVGGVIALSVLVGWAVLASVIIPGKDQEIASLEEEISRSKTQLDSLSKTQEEVKKLEGKKLALEDIVKHGNPMSVILAAVRSNVPQGVQVFGLKVEGSSCRIVGSAADFSKVSHFAINLVGSNVFSTGDIGFIKRLKTRPEQINYQLNCTVSPDVLKKVAPEPEEFIAGGQDGANSEQGDPNNQGPISSLPEATGGGKAFSGPNQLAAGRRPVLLDFTATWCGPCKALKPMLAQLRQNYGDKIEFKEIDIDDPQNKTLVDRYGVKSIPNLVFLDGRGDKIDQQVGFGGSVGPIKSSLDKLVRLASQSTTK